MNNKFIIKSQKDINTKHNNNNDNIFLKSEKYNWILNKNYIKATSKNNNNHKINTDILKKLGIINKIKSLNLYNYNLKPRNMNNPIINKQELHDSINYLLPNDKKIKNNKFNLKELKHIITTIEPKLESDFDNIFEDFNDININSMLKLINENDLEGYNLYEDIFDLISDSDNNIIDFNKIINLMKIFKINNIPDKDKNILYDCFNINNNECITKENFINFIKKIVI